MDDHEVLDLLDRHLDPLVPTAPAPVAGLLRDGGARRRRRRATLSAVVAAAVAAVAAGGVGVLARPGDDRTLDLAVPTQRPSAEPGTRSTDTRTWAYGSVHVSVPADWVSEPGFCAEVGGAASLDLVPPGSDGTCGTTPLVRAFDLDSRQGRWAERAATRETDLGGERALVGSSCPATAACVFVGRYVVLPDAGYGLLLSGPPEAEAVLDDALASIGTGTAVGADGRRLVGLGGVTVAVPGTWTSQTCLRPGAGVVQVGVGDCAGSTVILSRGAPQGWRDAPAYGVGVLVDDDVPCDDTSYCLFERSTVVHVPGRDVTVTVAGPADEADLRREVAASVSLLAEGLAVVPALDLPASLGIVCGALRRAGLVLAPVDPDCQALSIGEASALQPAAGEVVAAGSVVRTR